MAVTPIPASAHTFHIPVMGTGFTIDTPLKVARFGITSVISLVDHVLIEQMREYHCRLAGEPYEPILPTTPDCRARTISAYLDLLGRLVEQQSQQLRAEPFVPGSEITRYFELLPESPPKALYRQMLAEQNETARQALQEQLRVLAVPGGIDVNIMTKLEAGGKTEAGVTEPETNDAMSALRGFACSKLSSAVVFSAGLSRPLYSYAARFADFLPQGGQPPRKRIILKVSDFRSAVIQGGFFAKHGLWLSEFRVESGLNCGGHAFATKGLLMGPILAEFRNQLDDLRAELRGHYLEALQRLGLPPPAESALAIRITAQGGIGTVAEDQLLHREYGVDGTGWGTPFLLVPEAVNVDAETLRHLMAAGSGDVWISGNSPLGVPFWNLRTSASETSRRQRIRDGVPGSLCRKGYGRNNTEFPGQPVCTASRTYQAQKLEQLAARYPGQAIPAAEVEKVVAKTCICHDLAGSVARALGFDSAATPAICPGPDIAWFHRVASLDEMVGHIYGRLSLLAAGDRPHMFITELRLYVNELRRHADTASRDMSERLRLYLRDFRANLLIGIEHYRQETSRFLDDQKAHFLQELAALECEVNTLGAAVPAPG